MMNHHHHHHPIISHNSTPLFIPPRVTTATTTTKNHDASSNEASANPTLKHEPQTTTYHDTNNQDANVHYKEPTMPSSDSNLINVLIKNIDDLQSELSSFQQQPNFNEHNMDNNNLRIIDDMNHDILSQHYPSYTTTPPHNDNAYYHLSSNPNYKDENNNDELGSDFSASISASSSSCSSSSDDDEEDQTNQIEYSSLSSDDHASQNNHYLLNRKNNKKTASNSKSWKRTNDTIHQFHEYMMRVVNHPDFYHSTKTSPSKLQENDRESSYGNALEHNEDEGHESDNNKNVRVVMRAEKPSEGAREHEIITREHLNHNSNNQQTANSTGEDGDDEMERDEILAQENDHNSSTSKHKSNTKKKKSKEQKIMRHTHTHVHLRQDHLVLLFQISSSQLLDVKSFGNELGVVFKCKLPINDCHSKPHYIDLKKKMHTWEDIIEEIEITTPIIDMFHIMNEYSFVIEFKDESRETFIGITTLPLKNFAHLFSKQTGQYTRDDNEYPEIGYDGFVIVKNPLTSKHVAKLKILVSLGSRDQTERLKNQILGQVTTPQTSKLHQSKKNEVEVSDWSDTDDSSIEENNEKQHVQEKEERTVVTSSVFIPSFLPLSHVSRISIMISRATGLQEAARLVGKNNSLMQLAAQVGVNSFVQFNNILPTRSGGQEAELTTDETKIKAGTFCPVWNYVKHVDVVVDELVYSHLMQSEIILNFYHRISVTRTTGDDGKGRNIFLGSCSIPLRNLTTSKSGINGWYNIYGSGTMVGAVELSIQFDERTISCLFSKNETREPDSPHDVCRFTLFVEELDVPLQTLKEAIPSYMLRENENVSCSYYISYKFFDEKRVESRRYQASTSQRKIYFEYGMEYKRIMNQKFINLITCEKMPINLYMSVGSAHKKSLSTKLLGSVYIDLGPLYERQQVSKKKLVFISGIYTLINPRSSNLAGGHMKVKVCCETLSRTAAQQYLLEVNVPLDQPPDSDHKFPFDATKFDYPDGSDSETECIVTEETDQSDEYSFELELERSNTKRIRAEVVTTFSPAQSIDELPIHNQAAKLPDKDDDTSSVEIQEEIVGYKSYSLDPINYLNICIQEAQHLPMIPVSFSNRKTVPSCYVTLLPLGEATSEESTPPLSGSMAQTPVTVNTTHPRWHYQCRIPIYDNVEKLTFQVWHQTNLHSVTPIADILIGDCEVDISGLYYGLNEIDGWYHIQDIQKDSFVAQLKISVRTDKPIPRISSPQQPTSPLSSEPQEPTPYWSPSVITRDYALSTCSTNNFAPFSSLINGGDDIHIGIDNQNDVIDTTSEEEQDWRQKLTEDMRALDEMTQRVCHKHVHHQPCSDLAQETQHNIASHDRNGEGGADGR